MAIVLPLSAQAQETPADTGPMLEDIIVTAQKREQSLDKVPVSVQAVSGDLIAQQGTSGLDTLATTVPTLHISYGGLSEQLFIRGVGSGSNAGFEQSVGLFEDGIALGIPRLARVAFLDVERVEVLKGPQSTLFGKSTIAGVVNITSAQPRHTFEGRASALVDVDGDTRRYVEGFVTGPLSDRIAVRLAGKASTSNGAFYNTYLDRSMPYDRNYSGRFSILADPTDTLQLFASVQASKANTRGRSAQIGFVDTRFANVNAFIAQVRARDPDADFAPNRFRSTGRNPVACDECGSDRAVIGTFRATLDMGPAKINAITGYIDSKWQEQIDADATPLPITNTFLGQDTRQFSQELRLESDPDTAFTYIGGLYYQNSQIDAKGNCSDFDLGVIGRTTRIRGCLTSLRDETTMGVFAQGTYALTPALRVTAGGRYQVSDRNIHQTRVVPDPGAGSSPTTNPVVLATAASVLGQRPYDVRASAGEEKFTPSATIEWEPFTGGLIYASYRTGFKQGGYDVSQGTFNPATFQYAPESATSWELGLKTRFLDRRGRLNLSVFRSTFEDLQVSAFNGVGFTVGNAAKARSSGVEAELEFAIARGFTIGGDVAYLDAHYLNYANAPCFANQTAAQGCVTVGTARTQDLGDYRLPYSPRWSGSAHLNLRQPVGGGIVASALLQASLRTDQDYGPDADPNRITPGIALYDARLAIGDEDDRWEVAVVGKNLTNEFVPSFGFNTPLVAGAYTVQVDQPRVVSLQATVRF